MVQKKLCSLSTKVNSNFHDTVEILYGIRVMYNVNHRFAIRLKFDDKFVISLTKLLLKAKANVSALQSKKIYFYIVMLGICYRCYNLKVQ